MSPIVNTEHVKPHKSPKQKKQLKMTMFALLIIAAGIAAAYMLFLPKEKIHTLHLYESATVKLADMPRIVQATGTVQIPNQMIILSNQITYASQLLVSVGSTVEHGQILATTDVPDLDERIEDLELDLKRLQITYEKQLLDHSISLENKMLSLEKQRKDIADLITEIEKFAELVQINAYRQSDLEVLQAKLTDMEAQLGVLERDYTNTVKTQTLDKESTLQNLRGLELRHERALRDKALTSLTSPMNGEVVFLNSTLAVPGSRIASNTQLFTIADTQNAVFSLEIDERHASQLNLGEEASVTVGGSNYTGIITSIGRLAQTAADGIGATVEIEVTPKQQDGSLLPGSTAIAEFTLGVKENVLTLPRGAYLTTGNQRYVYRISEDTAERISVQFGEIQGSIAEILSGLEAGDEIIISGYQNFINHTTIKLQGE